MCQKSFHNILQFSASNFLSGYSVVFKSANALILPKCYSIFSTQQVHNVKRLQHQKFRMDFVQVKKVLIKKYHPTKSSLLSWLVLDCFQFEGWWPYWLQQITRQTSKTFKHAQVVVGQQYPTSRWYLLHIICKTSKKSHRHWSLEVFISPKVSLEVEQ